MQHINDASSDSLNCIANVYFNQECIKGNISLQDAKINVPHTPLATKFTKTKAQKMGIKDEIKFPYTKSAII
jgi:hypothetical protein